MVVPPETTRTKSDERGQLVGRVGGGHAAQVQRGVGHAGADAAARLPRMRQLGQVEVLARGRRRGGRPDDVGPVAVYGGHAVREAVVVADVRVVDLRRRHHAVERVVDGLLVLLERQLLDGVRLLALPYEHVVHHCAAAEDDAQADEHAGHYGWSRVELDERVQYYA